MRRGRGDVAAIAAVAVVMGVVAGWARPARAEDYVAIRGAYYREPSTRVIQPVVEVQRETASGFAVGAHFLVDAITSASAAAGTAVDNIFTELRSEVGANVGKRWSRDDASIGYKYSAESDYWSHAFGGSYAHRFWGDTGRLAFSAGASFDQASARGPRPCPVAPQSGCSLQAYFGGITYTQIISPVFLAQASFETAYLNGFQGNLYRAVPGLGIEQLPTKRQRSAASARAAYYFPRSKTGLQLQYRFYFDFYPDGSPTGMDPWGIAGHMVEGRVFQTLSRDLEVRLSYRQYVQVDAANFWCDALSRPGCYGANPTFFTTDPKLGGMFTEYPEIKVLWLASALAETPVLSWFSAGTFEISYGYFIQSTTFANAHVLQMGYRMPY